MIARDHKQNITSKEEHDIGRLFSSRFANGTKKGEIVYRSKLAIKIK